MKRRFARFLKSLDYRNYICIAITLGFAACAVFLFPAAFGRIIESFRDFGLSIAYYFCELFFIPHDITPTVNDLPAIGSGPVFIPDTYEGFAENWQRYWQLWASKENFFAYLGALLDGLYNISKFVIIVIPFILLLFIVISNYFKRQNNDFDKDSRPLAFFKKAAKYTYIPVKGWLQNFVAFVREHKYYWVTWLCIWAFNFNFFTIFIEFLAYYFYFVVSFDVVNLYRQVYKLVLDLSPMFGFVPLGAWIIIGFIIFDYVRKRIGYARLNHYERRNRGFINARPIVNMICGTMGNGKTTMLTDMCLSTEVMFRDRAFKRILENDLKFPYFPWINLENALKRAIEYHQVYNLATVKVYIQKKYLRWRKSSCRERLFDYDYERYGLTYDDKLKVSDIWEVLETYSQLYFIYIIQSSLIVSNYSVRVDNILSDLGNFPLWDSDFFRRDSRLIDSFSRHAHILDFDFLRLGKTVIENNEYRHALEFGVVAISEIGKERRNTLELRNRGIKAGDVSANQLNDGLNDGLKMRRQAATVDNDCYLMIISDEQRPESFGVDARALFDVINIADKGEVFLAMPFFSLGELLYDFLFRKFADLYYRYRHVRSDNTFFMYILKAVVAKVQHYYTGIYSRFGCRINELQIEKGTLDGQYKTAKYYVMSKKIYSNRFATDCLSAFWEERALRSPVGLDDLDEYKTSKATWDELCRQNSYFINDLMNSM